MEDSLKATAAVGSQEAVSSLEEARTLKSRSCVCVWGERGLRGLCWSFAGLLVLGQIFLVYRALGSPLGQAGESPSPRETSPKVPGQFRGETTQDYNRRLEELLQAADAQVGGAANQDYRIGPDDVLDVSVFEVPDLNRTVRVSAEGEILLPPLGNVRAAGLTPSGLASLLEKLLRESYLKDPHVGVFLREMQSHAVSVFGAVAKPGVYQIRGAKTLVEVLAMAQGLAPDAGDKVIVERRGSEPAMQSERADDEWQEAATANAPDQTLSPKDNPETARVHGEKAVEIHLKELMDSGDQHSNVSVNPGDVVKVARADVVYVVGEVHKPGGFQLNTNENISVLQALALAEGLTRTSAASRSRVIRTDRVTGNRTEIAIDIRRILAGKTPDQLLQPRDIVFVPNSAGKAAFYRGMESAVGIGSGLLIYRTP